MSKLDEMIRNLCPDGVEYKKLGEIATISRGGNFQKKDFLTEGVPCIHYGQIYTKYGLFTDKTFTFISEECAKKQKMAQPNDIVMAVTSENIEDVCKCLAWLGDEPVAVSGHSAIIHHNQNAKYLVYYFHSQMFFAQKRKLAHGTKVIEVTPDTLVNITLPVPPFEVQNEIVRILDDYTENVVELQNQLALEITARQRQYTFYRNKLLTYDSKTRIMPLKDVAEIERGTRVVRSQLTEAGLYPVFQNALTPMGYYDKANRLENNTFLICAGAAGQIGYSDVDFWAADDCYTFKCCEKLENRYLFHVLKNSQHRIDAQVRRASIPRISREAVGNIRIPIPPLDVQNRIVNVLDNFEKICSDLNIGLPAEIEARQKQYEYYRDKLLTFAETGNTILSRAEQSRAEQSRAEQSRAEQSTD